MSNLNLEDECDIDIENYLPSYDDMSQSMIPDTPGVNPANFNTATLNQGTVGTTGLTSTEQALLTPEEQAIRLRQRGMA